MRKYTSEHEWVELENGVITVGITDHAQHALGDIVFVELPEQGQQMEKGESFAVIESVKAVANVYCPADATVSDVNQLLEDEPQSINEKTNDAWIVKMDVQDQSFFDQLMDEAAYLAFVKEQC